MKKYFIMLFLFAYWLPSLAGANDPFRVGVIQSTTGIAAEDGQTVVQALQLAAEKLADQGIDVELLVEDDQTIPRKTVSAYQKLKAQGANIVIGATWDFTTNTLMSPAGHDGIVLFNTSTLPEAIKIEKANGYAFTNAISTYEEASPFSDFITSRAVKSIVVVYANNSWGETQRNVYREIAKRAGVENLGEYSSVSFDQNEWRTILPAIKSKKPDLLLLLLNKNDLEIFLRRAKETRFEPKYFASKNAFDAINASKNPSLYDGLCFTYPYEQLYSNKEFVAKYEAKFGEKPRIYADNTYDALFILAEAHKIARSAKISLKQALMQTEVSGLVGDYRYSKEDSFSLGKASMMCVKKGKELVVIKRGKFKTPNT